MFTILDLEYLIQDYLTEKKNPLHDVLGKPYHQQVLSSNVMRPISYVQSSPKHSQNSTASI